MKFRAALLAVPAVLALPLAAGPAAAHDHGSEHVVKLEHLNDSGASGTAWLHLDGQKLHVKIKADGLEPGQAPHAQHIHGGTDASQDFRCPTMADDKNKDGVLNTAEGVPDYGPVLISLTTKGDTSMKSGLALDRFPVADKDGEIHYSRTLTVSKDVAKNLKNLHVVQHGIDRNDNGKYDFSLGKSELNPKLPQEGTAPTSCGTIEGSAMGAMPKGGVETGSGGTEGVESQGLLAAGGATLLAAAGMTVAARRRRNGEAG